jgi:hypothetical protein
MIIKDTGLASGGEKSGMTTSSVLPYTTIPCRIMKTSTVGIGSLRYSVDAKQGCLENKSVNLLGNCHSSDH